MNIVDSNPSSIALVVVILRIDNNSFKLVASEENILQDTSTNIQSLVSKRWDDILEEETSNSNFDGHDDHDFARVKLGATCI